MELKGKTSGEKLIIEILKVHSIDDSTQGKISTFTCNDKYVTFSNGLIIQFELYCSTVNSNCASCREICILENRCVHL